MKVKSKVFDSASVAHVKAVYSDAAFTNAIVELRHAYGIGENQLLSFVRDDENNMHFVLIDNATGVMRKLDDNFGKQLQKLADAYTLHWSYVKDFVATLHISSHQPVKVVTDIKADPTDYPRYELHISRDATKQDVINALDDFDEQMHLTYGVNPKKRKHKGPENYKLVYAIHKQRQAGKTFLQIHREYMAGELSGYRGANTITSPDKFRQYYTKYKPQDVSNVVPM